MCTSPEDGKAYQELCTSYRAIDDFRAKLLGLLPLASGAGASLLISKTLVEPETQVLRQFLGPIGLFGFVVTLGLYFFELYGIRKCHALIEAGKKLESSLGMTAGQFGSRPRGVLAIINEPFASGIIYPAVLAGWSFVAFAFPQRDGGPAPALALSIAVRVFGIGFGVTLLYNLILAYGATLRRLILPRKVDTSTGA